MSALGQKRTSEHVQSMSALPPEADIGTHPRNVCFVPNSGHLAHHASPRVSGLVDARSVERSAKLFDEVASRPQITDNRFDCP